MKNSYRSSLLLGALMVLGATAYSQDALNPWVRKAMTIDSTASPHLQWLSRYESFSLDYAGMQSLLATAPKERLYPGSGFSVVSLPTPDGTVQRFWVQQSNLMSPALAAKTPVKTYRIKGIDDRSAIGCIDTGINGFHAFVRRDAGSFFVDPMKIGDKERYVSYSKVDNEQPRAFSCVVLPGPGSALRQLASGVTAFGPGDTRKTYRLAMNATGEYTAFYGGTAAGGQNGVITSINRINTVYEIDLAVRLNLVSNICYTNASTDPYTNNNGVTMLGQNQVNTDTTVGSANYDMGHVFSTGGGGVANLGVVGINGSKARGVTGSPSPIGDAYDIDYVAHEMGHQFGANHTFNGTTSSCGGGNRAASAAYEPGSGSTIMAYAGICGAENVQSNSDAYFHYKSMEEAWNHRNNVIPGVGTSTATGNMTPSVNAGADYTIPIGTPFKLTATGSDPNSDPITYCWEQYNLGTASPTTDNTTRPLFRSFNPTTNPTRFLPRFPDLLSGAATPWEILPTVARSMTWRCTVRDNFPGSGGYATDTMVITATGAAFAVTSPNTAVSWAGNSSQTVTWTVGGGSVAPNVNIWLSTNGGTSYSTGTATLLLANTPNDGSQAVTIPNVAGTTNRIIVEAAGNIFFDVSNVNFTITAASNPVPALTSISPSSATAAGSGFTLTVNGSNFVSGAVVRWNGSDRATTFVNSGQLTASIAAADIATVGNRSVTVFNPAPGGGLSNALTFAVNPIEVAPSSYTLPFGNLVSGNVGSLGQSDDNRLAAGFSWIGARLDPNVRIEAQGTTPSSTASRIDLTVESQTQPAGQTQRVYLYNNSTLSWDLVDTFVCLSTDTARTVSVTSGAANYRGAGGLLRVRVDYFAAPTNPRVVQAHVDYIHWTVYP